MGEVVRIEWPTGAPVIAIEADAARTMMKNNYAFNIDDEKMKQYNDAVDAYLKAVADAPVAPAADATPAPAAPTAPTAPPAPDTPAVPDVPKVPDAPAAETPAGGTKKGK